MSSLKNIIDTHSHYDDPRFDGDRYALVGSLFERGMSAIIHAATDLRSTIFGIKWPQARCQSCVFTICGTPAQRFCCKMAAVYAKFRRIWVTPPT